MSKWKHLSCCYVFLRNYQFKLYLLAPNMNVYFCHFNSIQSPSFTISFCTCNNNFLYRWKKSACGLKHLSNLNAQLPLSYCIVRRHTFGKSRIFLLPNNITPRTFHNSMYTLLSFHIYPHSISHLLKWKTTQGCYVQHLHVPMTRICCVLTATSMWKLTRIA